MGGSNHHHPIVPKNPDRFLGFDSRIIPFLPGHRIVVRGNPSICRTYLDPYLYHPCKVYFPTFGWLYMVNVGKVGTYTIHGLFGYGVFPWKQAYSHKINSWKMTCPFEMVPFFRGQVNFGGYLFTSWQIFERDYLFSPVKTSRRKLHCSSPTRTSKHQGPAMYLWWFSRLQLLKFWHAKSGHSLKNPRNKTTRQYTWKTVVAVALK